MRQRADALRSLANTTDANGRYLFAGYSEATSRSRFRPAGSVVYNGDQGQRTLQVGQPLRRDQRLGLRDLPEHPDGQRHLYARRRRREHRHAACSAPAASSNPAAWVRDTYTITFLTPTTYEVRDSAAALVASGTYTGPKQSIQFRGIDVPIDGAPAAGDTFTVAPSAKRDVFATINALATSLETSSGVGTSRTRLHSERRASFCRTSTRRPAMSSRRAPRSARACVALDEETSFSDGFRVQLAETISGIRDLDYAEALTRLSQQLFGLEAAQQAFARDPKPIAVSISLDRRAPSAGGAFALVDRRRRAPPQHPLLLPAVRAHAVRA